MKQRTLIILILLAVLLASSAPLARTASAGGGYHLTALTWQVTGSSGAGGYHLQSPYGPTLTGNGCCCTYLPCTVRNYTHP